MTLLPSKLGDWTPTCNYYKTARTFPKMCETPHWMNKLTPNEPAVIMMSLTSKLGQTTQKISNVVNHSAQQP